MPVKKIYISADVSQSVWRIYVIYQESADISRIIINRNLERLQNNDYRRAHSNSSTRGAKNCGINGSFSWIYTHGTHNPLILIHKSFNLIIFASQEFSIHSVPHLTSEDEIFSIYLLFAKLDPRNHDPTNSFPE